MISRSELKRLQGHQDYPSVSLLAPTTNVLTEFTGKPFPMTHKGPGGTSRLPGGQGINRSAVRDESHRQFFRKVDEALASIQKEDHLPLVVVGIDRYLAFYQEVTKDPDAIVGVVAGSLPKRIPARSVSSSGPSSRRGTR